MYIYQLIYEIFNWPEKLKLPFWFVFNTDDDLLFLKALKTFSVAIFSASVPPASSPSLSSESKTTHSVTVSDSWVLMSGKVDAFALWRMPKLKSATLWLDSVSLSVAEKLWSFSRVLEAISFSFSSLGSFGDLLKSWSLKNEEVLLFLSEADRLFFTFSVAFTELSSSRCLFLKGEGIWNTICIALDKVLLTLVLLNKLKCHAHF